MEQKEDYNVIWIDDEWDTIGKAFIQICEIRHNIHITPFKTRREGIDALEQNLKFWDAVILDAKAFNNSSTNEVASVDGLFAARDRLLELRQRRYIPFFVFTRQPDLFKDEMFEKAVGKYYKKDAAGQASLITAIKEEVSLSPRHQLRVQYSSVLDRLYSIDIESGESILNIFEAMHYPQDHPDFEPIDHYNKLRKILEWNYKESIKYGIIPEECVENGIVNLNQSCCYLCGLNCDHIHLRYGDETQKEHIVPKHIKDMMFLVLYLGNIKSHTAQLPKEDIDRLEVYLKDEVRNSRYLIFSLALQICEITMWLGRYMDEHPNKEENLKNCVKLDVQSTEEKPEFVGVIERDEKGFYHIGTEYSVLLKNIELVGKNVKITNYKQNTSSCTKKYYPLFVREQDLELIEEQENSSK
ncbi:MAG: hypothetical protein IJP46_03220 [Prevotella sp.]|nr:hypothetical protein [Prevotella sp.]